VSTTRIEYVYLDSNSLAGHWVYVTEHAVGDMIVAEVEVWIPGRDRWPEKFFTQWSRNEAAPWERSNIFPLARLIMEDR
jgi:hypothetical protein